jgi:phosphomannomutase/phosphoglucomutase
MITGSHNGREYNGIKIVMQGKSLTEDGIHSLRNRIVEQGFAITEGQRGRYGNKSVADRYVERVCEDVVVARRLKVVVDAANGIAGPIAPRVFQALGCSVEPLYCELDGDFPNHDPDPTRPGNLHALQAAVRAKRADLGIAFDGDGDRVVFVTSTGEVVYPDQVLMVLAQDVVARHPGATVVYDVKCSSHVAQVVSEAGGIPLMCRSGHSYVKHQLETSKAQLGGEFTGHIFLSERWYGFDDGIYVAARMLELLSLSPKKLHQILDTLPASVSTPELLVETDDSHKFVIIGQLKAGDYFADAELNLLDGIRAEFPFGWGLVRASNTCPALSLRFEADTADNLAKIQAEFRQALNTVDPTLVLGF